MIGRVWRALFPPPPERLLGKVDFPRVRWTSVSFNTHAYLDYFPNARVEIEDGGRWVISHGRRADEGRWDVWHGDAHRGGRSLVAGREGLAPLWLFTHMAVKEAFDAFKPRASAPVGGQTALTLQSESRALQWLQTSFRVLAGALENCRPGDDRVVVATLTLGEREEGKALVRVQCFNLDATAWFRPDGSLEVLVFDDKDKGPGSSAEPVLRAEFATLKAPVLDELIKLASAVTGAAERKGG